MLMALLILIGSGGCLGSTWILMKRVVRSNL
jgi:hypothetical protein